jgi:NAD(P)-dependent dehydrogenase (short-subunit alcohol dehydrogenase family)
MRVLLTGAGNLGTALVERLTAQGQDILVVDVRAAPLPAGAQFVEHDLARGAPPRAALEGVDVVVHTAAWHGIHEPVRSRDDYWRLNATGTFALLEACVAAGTNRFVYLSSTAVTAPTFYGLTKRVGEDLCKHYATTLGARCAAVRPGNFTPWHQDDWVNGYGARLLYDGVDRDDVLACTELALMWANASPSADWVVLDAVRSDPFTEEDVEDWEADPVAVCSRLFPGSEELIERHGIDIARRPNATRPGLQTIETGYSPRHHFGTFLAELASSVACTDITNQGATFA